MSFIYTDDKAKHVKFQWKYHEKGFETKVRKLECIASNIQMLIKLQ